MADEVRVGGSLAEQQQHRKAVLILPWRPLWHGSAEQQQHRKLQIGVISTTLILKIRTR